MPQVWHLPTDPIPPTGKEFIHEVAKAFGTPPAYRRIGPGLLRLASLLHPAVGESLELLYQNQNPCIVDSSKFENHFFKATPWPEGVRRTAQGMRLPQG